MVGEDSRKVGSWRRRIGLRDTEGSEEERGKEVRK
jgi:hypothetical protein